MFPLHLYDQHKHEKTRECVVESSERIFEKVLKEDAEWIDSFVKNKEASKNVAEIAKKENEELVRKEARKKAGIECNADVFTYSDGKFTATSNDYLVAKYPQPKDMVLAVFIFLGLALFLFLIQKWMAWVFKD
jgi:hypothetical protein